MNLEEERQLNLEIARAKWPDSMLCEPYHIGLANIYGVREILRIWFTRSVDSCLEVIPPGWRIEILFGTDYLAIIRVPKKPMTPSYKAVGSTYAEALALTLLQAIRAGENCRGGGFSINK